MVLGRFIVLFVTVPIVELSLLLVIGRRIGVALTIGVVMITGIIGAVLVKRQGMLVLSKIKNQFDEGRLPTDSLLEGLLILMGGIFLITPGIMTDAVGFLLIIPQSRVVILDYVKKFLRYKLREKGIYSSENFHQ